MKAIFKKLPPNVQGDAESYGEMKAIVQEWLDTASSKELEKVGEEALIGSHDDRLPVEFFERGQKAKQPVGLVSVMNEPSGTGFLVGQGLMITNHHVIGDPAAAKASSITLGKEEDRFGDRVFEEEFALDPDRFFYSNKKLDFTIVACEAKSERGEDLKNFGVLPLERGEGKIAIGGHVNVIQHPQGGEKVISCREGKLMFIDNNDHVHEAFLYYSSDTEPGSSGSPLFNDDFDVIGIHHHSFPHRDKNGHILDKSGKRLSAEIVKNEPSRVHWIANEGTRISRLVGAFESASLANEEMEEIRRSLLSEWR